MLFIKLYNKRLPCGTLWCNRCMGTFRGKPINPVYLKRFSSTHGRRKPRNARDKKPPYYKHYTVMGRKPKGYCFRCMTVFPTDEELSEHIAREEELELIV